MEYYIHVNNEKRGPYAPEELINRGLTAESLVMAADGDQWIPAWQVEELRPVLMRAKQDTAAVTDSQPASEAAQPVQTAQPAQPKQESAPQAAAGQGGDGTAAARPKKRGGHGCLWALLALVLIGALMFYTCPSKEKHSEAIATVVSDGVSEAVQKEGKQSNDILGKAIDMVGSNLRKKVIETVADQFLEVDNHKLLSVGKIHYDGKDHVVSVGVLGYVFTVGKDKIKEVAEQYYVDKEDEFKKSVEEQINENVVDPMKDKVKEILGGVLGSIFGSLGISPDVLQEMEELPADSI